jgi:uncharacterized membrane protein
MPWGVMFPFVLVGAVLIAVAIPMWLRRVPPNPLYGLRVPATFADPWVWYEANAASGRDLIVNGVLLIVVAVALEPIRSIPEPVYVLCCALVLGIGAMVTVTVGWRRANRLLEQRREEQRRA